MEIDIESFKKLFQYRSEQDEQSSKTESNPIIISLFSSIPSFSISQLLQFSYSYKNAKNMKLALSKLGYNYPFKKETLMSLIEERTENSQYPIIIATYQLISLLFLSDNGQMISTDDFSLFMQLLNYKNNLAVQSEMNLLFDLLLKSALKTQNFEWNQNNIDSVFQQFFQNKGLTANFFVLFNDFINVVFQLIPKDDLPKFQTKVIDLITVFYKENRPILKNCQLLPILDWIEPRLQQLNANTFYLLSKTSNQIDSQPKSSLSAINDKFRKLINLLSPLFVNQTKSSNFRVTESKQIHNICEVFPVENFHQNKLFNFEFTTEKVFENEQLNNLPESLVNHKPFALFDRLDENVKTITDQFAFLASNLDLKWSICFLDDLGQYLRTSYCQPEHYSSFASYFYLLWQLYSQSHVQIDLVKYFSCFFDSFFFNPSYSVFGPISLDPLLNDFRQTIIDILLFNNFQNPILQLTAFTLLRKQKSNPFLLTETILRLILHIPLEKLLFGDSISDVKSLSIIEKQEDNLTIINNDLNISSLFDSFLQLVSHTALALKISNAPIEPRNSIIYVFFELITNSYTSYKSLTAPIFVNCMFNFVFENGLSQMFLTVIHKSLLYIKPTDKIKPLQYLVNIMYHSVRAVTVKMNSCNLSYIKNIKTCIYRIVSNLTQLKPRMTKLFDRFVVPMLHDANSQQSMSEFIFVLIAFSAKRHFHLTPKIFSMLAEKVKFLRYTDILNLIGMSTSISGELMFFFRRPCYLPLLFIAFNDDEFRQNNPIDFENDVLDYLNELVEYSDYNKRALHDGQIDFILLSYLNNEDPIYINGFPLRFKYKSSKMTKTAFYLLDLIVPTKCSNSISNKLVNTLLFSKKPVADNIYKIITNALNQPKPQFPIGNFQAFCKATNLNYFFKDSNFTIMFDIKVDTNLLDKSTSQVLILSIFDRYGKRLSISLMTHGLYASYLNNDVQTIVSLGSLIPANQWAAVTIIFTYKKEKSMYQIITYVNHVRQHDSDFCPMKFDNASSLTLMLGSSLYEGRTPTKYFEQIATIANLSIYGHAFRTKMEVLNVITNSILPDDLIFTTKNFNESMYKSPQKVMFYNNNVLEVKYIKNRYENTSFDRFLGNYNSTLINQFKSIDNEKYKYALFLLSITLKGLKSSDLIKKFAYILIDESFDQNKLNYYLHQNLYEMYFSLYQSDFKEYKEDQFHLSNSWLELIVFNINIWKKSKDFSRILHLWSTSLSNTIIYNRFFKSNERFSIFLTYFDEFIQMNEQENKPVINEFILFLARVSHANMTVFDVQHLLSALSNSKSFHNIQTYLKLIQYVSPSIRNTKYDIDDFSPIYSLIQENSDNLDLVLLSIITLQSIYFDNFHLKVLQIYKSFSQSTKSFKAELFDKLQKKIYKYPNLFSLTSCIAFDNRDLIAQITVIPEPHQITRSEFWFFFPLLLAVNNFSDKKNSELSTKLFNLLAANAIDGPYMKQIINMILVFTKLATVNLIESNDKSFPDELLYFVKILQIFVANGDVIEYNKIIYTIYFDTIGFVCYHLQYAKNIERKIVLDSIDNLDLFVNQFFLENDAVSFFSFTYQIELIDDRIIRHKDLLMDSIHLSNTFLDSYVLYQKYQKQQKSTIPVGDSSVQPLDFQISDINNVLSLFLSKFDVTQPNNGRNETVEDFAKMNSIFEWMHNTLQKKFTKHFSTIKTLLVDQLFGFQNEKYKKFDPQFWINYQKTILNQQRHLINDIIHQATQENEFSEPLPILTTSFGSFLYQNPHQDEKAKSEEFANSLLEFKEEDADSDPNAYNIKYGIKIPVRCWLDTNHFVFRNESIPYSMFSYIISMSTKEKRNDEEKTKIDGMIENSILFILTNHVCFLIGFERGDKGKEKSIAFLQEIKKKVNSECLVFNSRDEMIEKLSSKIFDWFSYHMSTFDLLCILNLFDGRTYLASGKNRMSDISNPSVNQYYPLFPSIDFITNEKPGKLFDDAEIYFLLDLHPNAYENRKLLEQSDKIDEFIKLAFPNLYSKISHLTKSPQPFKRQKHEINSIETQKLKISKYTNSNVLYISSFKTEPNINVICYVFKNGDLMMFKHSIDSNGKLHFEPITIKKLDAKDTTNNCKSLFSVLPGKNGINIKYIKSMKLHQYKKGILIYNLTYLLTVYINRVRQSQSNSLRSDSLLNAFQMSNLYSSQFIPTFSMPAQSNEQHPVEHLSVVESSADLTSSNSVSATIHVQQDLELFFEQFLISNTVFVKNPSTISKFDDDNYHKSIDLLITTANITCIESNEKYQIVVIGCDDGRLIVHGLLPGIRLSSIQLRSDILPIPLLILITDRSGFILTYTSTSQLILSTVYGTIVKSIENFNQISTWISFVPIDEQIDYIAFIGSVEKHDNNEKDICADINNNYLCFFEALKPDDIKVVAKLPENCSQVILEYDEKNNCFIIATYQKEIICVSRMNHNSDIH